MDEEIPIIDMQADNDGNKLREACEKWGCFRVVNHGVPPRLMAEIKSVAVELFDRPVDIKQRNKEGLPGSGYVGLTQTNQVYEALGVDIFSSLTIPSFCSDLHASPHQRPENAEKSKECTGFECYVSGLAAEKQESY
ncbi:2-oxoglutarate-dependent dioxygenase DAO-like [Silene latifolia]|uniref:2-oxoglutarate-dependent dioxygenase DAO-like n=1 Tax=Silene latifolia TaxID=37657 RepID=UPI003D77A6EE